MRDVHENIEIDQNAVLLLVRRVAVLFERFEVTRYGIVLIVGRDLERR